MARIRSIHPEICIDKDLAEMDDAGAERTFMRLWTYCDDDGRAYDDARLIKSAIYPRQDSMTYDAVEQDITKLAERGFVVRYEVDGERYLYVPSFTKWQKPNRRVASKLPAPIFPGGAQSQCALTEYSLSTHVQDTEYSLLGVGEGEGEVVNAHAQQLTAPAPYETEFTKVWEHYPRKLDRGRALASFVARRRAGVPFSDLLSATQHYAKSVAGKELTFVKHGSTFYGPSEPFRDFIASDEPEGMKANTFARDSGGGASDLYQSEEERAAAYAQFGAPIDLS